MINLKVWGKFKQWRRKEKEIIENNRKRRNKTKESIVKKIEKSEIFEGKSIKCK